MFELNIALKYLLPKRRSLSTALISVLSVAVISLVVWLVLVFLSVTSGIEKNWLAKLTALNAPLRLTPTEEYYRSYFYQIDGLSAASNYTVKTIGEKAASLLSDPYSTEHDMEIPPYWPQPDRDATGQLKDPVRLAIREIETLKAKFPGLRFQDYEVSGALLKLQLDREGHTSYLSQMSYLLSLPEENPRLVELLVPSTKESPFAAKVDGHKIILPNGPEQPILLPKSYQDNGVWIGDRGYLAYNAPSAATAQEQRIQVRVAGFYDPGFLSLGNRCLIVPGAVTRTIYTAAQTYSPDGTPTNGFFLWPASLEELPAIKEELALHLQQAGIASYWKIASYEEYEFAKDLFQQFRSDKTLFTLIAGIILLVACCNIISLLVLLVNDKKREIAILQSMGAPKKSIAAIFATCGITMGLLSCLVGSALALLTLRHLDSLVSLLSAAQGRAAFNPLYFGQHLPNQLSKDALLFVLLATPFLSLLAGLIPALKASRIRPSVALRSE
ncbi:MAG: ABC transporter permease [Verrucomicrobiota bacterium]|nr:ABC transporter permease [Verrucomicrobiota bacterium]